MKMELKEAIFCMHTYLLEGYLKCSECPYYRKEKDKVAEEQYGIKIYICPSSEAHQMAIDALEKMEDYTDNFGLTKEEAIYCLKSYLPVETKETCQDCPYYTSHELLDVGHPTDCKSGEVHKLAIKALERML